jgi:hypothetical protein
LQDVETVIAQGSLGRQGCTQAQIDASNFQHAVDEGLEVASRVLLVVENTKPSPRVARLAKPVSAHLGADPVAEDPSPELLKRRISADCLTVDGYPAAFAA